MTNRTLFKNIRLLFTTADPTGVTHDGAVYVEGSNIIDVGPSTEIAERHESEDGIEIVDCTNKIVMPGLVDGHNHLCNSNLGLGVAFVTQNYGDIEEHVGVTIHNTYGWQTEQSLYDITMASLLNALKHGVTTVANATIMPEVGYRAMAYSGMRGILQPQMLTAERLHSDNLDEQGYLRQAEECIKAFHDPDGLIQVSVHPSWPWNTRERLQQAVMALAHDHDLKYVTHLWEFPNEKERANALWASEGGGLQHLYNAGLINDHCVFFHASVMDEKDLDLIAESGASIIHNPIMNSAGVGTCAYVPYMLDAGINVGLGTDYGSLNMFDAMFLMLATHNIMPRAKVGVPFWAPMQAATLGSARAYDLDKKVGSLEAGKRADIITIDLTRASGLLPLNPELIEFNPERVFFLFTRHGASLETSDSMVNGVFLRRNGEFTRFDEEAIVAKAFEWCSRCTTDLGRAVKNNSHYFTRVHRCFTKDSDS